MHDTDKLKITEILEQASTLGLISTLKALKELLPVLTSLYEQSLKESAAPDTRPGADTYGYKNAESILANCEYISDRWNNSFRLRWLIDLCKLEKYETNS